MSYRVGEMFVPDHSSYNIGECSLVTPPKQVTIVTILYIISHHFSFNISMFIVLFVDFVNNFDFSLQQMQVKGWVQVEKTTTALNLKRVEEDQYLYMAWAEKGQKCSKWHQASCYTTLKSMKDCRVVLPR